MKLGGGSVIIPREEGDVSELVSPNHSTHANPRRNQWAEPRETTASGE